MLTMSHSINASERGSWKESYRSGDSVETNSSSEESDNSSSGGGCVVGARQPASNGGTSTGSNSQLAPPIACITTHSVSAVIRPERKMPPIDPLQFVKIQKNELSKKAVEQIKLAEEVKITKEKIKEVEEEWQNNLMSWKSKRKLTKNNSEDESLMQRNSNRKTKTFSEILHEKARSGARIGYNLHKYVSEEDDEEFDIPKELDPSVEQMKSESVDLPHDSQEEQNWTLSDQMPETNLNRFLNSNTPNNHYEEQISRNSLGEMVVFNTSLLEEFSVKSEVNCDKTQQPVELGDDQHILEPSTKKLESHTSEEVVSNGVPHKVHVPINEWKSPSKETQQHTLRQSSASSDDDAQHHNSSFEGDEEDELDEEFERLKLDQERSFKAKLSTFEALAKQEEEAAKRAAEANIRRRQNRQKLIAERSKSLSNIQQSTTQSKALLTNSYSVSNSALKESIVSEAIHPSIARSHFEKQAKSASNVNATHQPGSHIFDKPSANSVVYNFKDKPKTTEEEQQTKLSPTLRSSPISKQRSVEINQSSSQSESNGNKSQMNIYENVASLGSSQSLSKQVSQLSPSETISDSDAIRNASQKLLQQQQQIYQNQPLPVHFKQAGGGQYPSDHYSNLPAHSNYVYPYEMHAKQPHVTEPMPPTDALMNEKVVNPVPIRGGFPIGDSVGLPPLQVTKTTQVVPEEHLYQNQLMINSSLHANYIGYGGAEIPSRREELAAYPPEVFHHQPPPQQQVMSQYMNRQQQQYLYYPKPYSGANSGHKPVAKQSVGTRGSAGQSQGSSGRGSANSAHQLPYNKNHWLLQEAELRQSNQRLTKSSQMHSGKNPLGGGYLSVSGKKKCSSCGDELGKGCAAMVVESLSLYYHINCFRCSVCNVQLGNGTVGTDVRVRNNKLHCQNCYSNDEAGLKFSRV